MILAHAKVDVVEGKTILIRQAASKKKVARSLD
jgi:hypothetical protein